MIDPSSVDGLMPLVDRIGRHQTGAERGEPEHRDESGGKEREEQPAEEQDRPRLVELAVPVRRPVGPLPLGLGTLEVGLLHPTQADTPASGLAENRTVSEDALKTGS